MRLFLVAVATAVAVMTACGGGGGPGDERAELSQAVRDYSEAYLGGRAEAAHELLSARCRDRVTVDALSVATAAASRTFAGARMTSLDVDALEGSLARVTYRYDNPAIDQEAEPWTKEAGQWRQDDC